MCCTLEYQTNLDYDWPQESSNRFKGGLCVFYLSQNCCDLQLAQRGFTFSRNQASLGTLCFVGVHYVLSSKTQYNRLVNTFLDVHLPHLPVLVDGITVSGGVVLPGNPPLKSSCHPPHLL